MNCELAVNAISVVTMQQTGGKPQVYMAVLDNALTVITHACEL